MNLPKVLLADETLQGTLEGLGDFQPAGEDAPGQLEILFSRIFGFLTIIGGIGFLIYFIIGGIKWITAGGDQQKIDTAKNTMTSAAIGMIVIVATYAITWIIGEVLGFNILSLEESINSITSP